MAKSYVKFEVSKEVADKALEAVRLAKQKNAVRKGVNEATKSIERGMASLVVLAEDVEPEEVVMHIPMLCEQKKITLVYVPTKLALGQAAGLKVPCTAITIEKSQEADPLIKDIAAKVSGKSGAASAESKKEVEKKVPKQKKEEPKKEEAKQ
ncbi:MAG: 50S ribosomal protein L7Ae [Candidatus Micrarchaeota archaeon]|nr:50S ribosomal protein L7Ae [Candidatus Micrarchaeota archaeon]MDE1848248.1 50S ribosomal protein L7Ae [Candidatus Micrarchaeota archaeon]MDE1864898.1 50S ribosomal protein L7Ae [Candidatus Micrarchaeota archaeon]